MALASATRLTLLSCSCALACFACSSSPSSTAPTDAGFEAETSSLDGGADTGSIQEASPPDDSSTSDAASEADLDAGTGPDASTDSLPDTPTDDSPPDASPDAPDATSPADAAPDAPYDGPLGTPDPTFGTSGSTITLFPEDGGSFNQVNALDLDPEAGTVTVAASAVLADQLTWETGLARFTSAGAPDTTFASTGVLATNFGLSTQPVAGGLAIQPDHRMLVSGMGYASATTNGFFVTRLTTAGALDTTFAASGVLSTSPPSGSYDGAFPILLDATGFVVAGWEATGTASDFSLWRFGLGAAPVTGFGTGGQVKTTVVASKGAHATSLARQSTQKILAAGNVLDPASLTYDAAVVRYTAAGVLDTTFAASGIALSGQPNDAAADAIAVQPDDRVVVAGYTTPGAHPLLTVWRLTADGALDTTFGTGGVAAFSFAQLGGRASSVALQADGRIVVAGVIYPLGQVNMVVYRLMPDGTLDASFGSGGLIVSTSSTSDYADVVAIQPDGAIVVAGTSNYGELTLWRYR